MNRTSTAALAILLFAAALNAAPGDATSLQIGVITVTPVNVFSPEEARNFAYRFANSLHVETRETVIRGRLLFHEGDPYDPALLEQSERNLRSLGFIKSATITASAPHDGIVDVSVVTQDAWTLQPEFSIGSKGGTTAYSFALSDSNILGLGRDLSIAYDKGSDRTRELFAYNDPAFIRPYWNAKLLFADNSDGSERAFAISRPFFAFSTPWSTQIAADDLTQDSRIYTDGAVSSHFQQQHRQFLASYGFALTQNDAYARRLTAGLDFTDDVFSPISARPVDVIPDGREFRYAFVRYQDVASEFVKLNFVNKDVRFEDFNLGRDLSLDFGVSPAAFGAGRTTERVRVSASKGFRIFGDGFLLSRVAYETRFASGSRQNEIASGELRLVNRIPSERPQVILGRLIVDQGWNLDRDFQFFADGATGLRGYRLHSFEGNKRVILNLEHRVYLGREIFQLISPAVAAFADTGMATPDGTALRLRDLKTDAGIGLRFGSTRTPNNVLRIDFSYAFDPDPFGRRGFLLSFSSSQAF